MTSDQAFVLLSEYIKKYEAQSTLVIAIDGRSSSGKTTFAEKITKAFGLPVIHTDDFFRPRDNNGNLNLTEYNGNFDISRFKTEVVNNIRNNSAFSYNVFDCSAGKITASRNVAHSSCYIVEGAYSLHPNLGNYADIKVFFDVSADIQKARILARNGEYAYNRFKNIWIPAEERYFEHYNIVSFCDITVNTSSEV